MILQFIANGLCTGALYAIMAIGFGLIYNSTKIFHFAHGAVYVASAYLLYLFWVVLDLPMFIAILGSLCGAALLGVIIEMFIYQPIRRKKFSSTTMMISSFGVYIFVVNLIAMLTGNETKVLNPGIGRTFTFADIILNQMQLLSVLCFILIFSILLILRKTKYGQIILAFSNNPKLMETLGWNSKKIRIYIFAIGSSFAGIAACLSALDVGIDPNIGMNALFVSIIAVIIGGAKAFEGAVVGSLLLGLLQSLVVWQFSTRWIDAFTFFILIVFLLFRPQGLLGGKLRIEEYK
ncbi:branched-chain amino acid ABC transporter permease [Thermodesulfobacteriota bacterium]